MFALGRSLAVKNRLSEPARAQEALVPPLSYCWNEALPILRDYIADPSRPWQPVAERLGKVADVQ
jgi:hypothetical protein